MISALVRVPALRLSLFAAGWNGLPRLRPSMPNRRHWLPLLVLATSAALYVVAALSVTIPASMAVDSRAAAAAELARGVQAPEPEPLRFRAVAPEDAVALNAAVPVADLPNPAARPFLLGGSAPIDRMRSIDCLTSAIYYEAATEPLEGQRAVAQVVLNRVRHPAYPKTVCGVVFQGSQRTTGCQFTFTCDGSLRRAPAATWWARARKVAEEALAGHVYAPVGYATHYHTNWVVPYWSSSLVKAAVVGTHIFYRWAGGWGKPAAFRQRYAGVEPDVSRLGRRTAADPALLAAEAANAAAAAAAEKALADAAAATPTPIPAEMSQRAVVRRYEPLSREAATATAIARGGEPASSAYRWALSGGSPNSAGAPLGRRTETAPAAPAANAPAGAPRCLEGVRRRGDANQPATEQPAC